MEALNESLFNILSYNKDHSVLVYIYRILFKDLNDRSMYKNVLGTWFNLKITKHSILKIICCKVYDFLRGSTCHEYHDGLAYSIYFVLPNGIRYFNIERSRYDDTERKITFYLEDERKRYSCSKTKEGMDVFRMKDDKILSIDICKYTNIVNHPTMDHKREYKSMYYYLKTMKEQELSTIRLKIDMLKKKMQTYYDMLNLDNKEICCDMDDEKDRDKDHDDEDYDEDYDEDEEDYNDCNDDRYYNMEASKDLKDCIELYNYNNKTILRNRNMKNLNIIKQHRVKKNRVIETLLSNVNKFIPNDSLAINRFTLIKKIKKCRDELQKCSNTLAGILFQLSIIDTKTNYVIQMHQGDRCFFSTYNVTYLFPIESTNGIKNEFIDKGELDIISHGQTSCDSEDNCVTYDYSSRMITADLSAVHYLVTSFHIPGVDKVDRISLRYQNKNIYTVKNTNTMRFDTFPIMFDEEEEERFSIRFTIDKKDSDKIAELVSKHHKKNNKLYDDLAERNLLKKYRPVMRYGFLQNLSKILFDEGTYMFLAIKDKRQPLNSIYISNRNDTVILKDIVDMKDKGNMRKILIRCGKNLTRTHYLSYLYIPLDTKNIPKILRYDGV